jgi:hypothetical protein
MSALTIDEHRDTLRERKRAAQRELQAAERAAGSAELDGGDVATASAAVTTARDALDRIGRAMSELDARELAEQERERKQDLAAARLRTYLWQAEFLRRLEPVLKLRAELDAAEAHAMAMGNISVALRDVPDLSGRAERGQWLGREAGAGRLDARVVNALPQEAVVGGDQGRLARPYRVQDNLLTVERVRELLPRLEQLAERAAGKVDEERRAEREPWDRGSS